MKKKTLLFLTVAMLSMMVNAQYLAYNPLPAEKESGIEEKNKGTWKILPDIPNAQLGPASVVLDGKFHVIGGAKSCLVSSDDHQVYDPATNTWSTVSGPPDPLYFATFSTTEGEGYVISAGGGGGYGSWPATTMAAYYDPVTDTWTTDTPIPWSARGLNSTIYMGDDEVMVAGGYDGFFYTDGYRGTGWFSATTPVVLSAFNANIVEDGVLLTWKTASDTTTADGRVNFLPIASFQPCVG